MRRVDGERSASASSHRFTASRVTSATGVVQVAANEKRRARMHFADFWLSSPQGVAFVDVLADQVGESGVAAVGVLFCGYDRRRAIAPVRGGIGVGGNHRSSSVLVVTAWSRDSIRGFAGCVVASHGPIGFRVIERFREVGRTPDRT